MHLRPTCSLLWLLVAAAAVGAQQPSQQQGPPRPSVGYKYKVVETNARESTKVALEVGGCIPSLNQERGGGGVCCLLVAMCLGLDWKDESMFYWFSSEC
jgi:hypothetical protein